MGEWTSRGQDAQKKSEQHTERRNEESWVLGSKGEMEKDNEKSREREFPWSCESAAAEVSPSCGLHVLSVSYFYSHPINSSFSLKLLGIVFLGERTSKSLGKAKT